MTTSPFPMQEQSSSLTVLLEQWHRGDHEALNALMPVVYDELRRLAHGIMRLERDNLTLSTTALVHEAYLNLTGPGPELSSRAHFFGIAARVMRRVLVDWARRRNADKRGGGMRPELLAEDDAATEVDIHTVLAVDHALGKLERVDERLVRVVECRYFAGLSIADTAETLGIAPATVKRDWTVARAWLQNELGAS